MTFELKGLTLAYAAYCCYCTITLKRNESDTLSF